MLEKRHYSIIFYIIKRTSSYGISSFVFREARRFHPKRFGNYINNYWHGVIIRSKGLFWIASRPKDALNWEQAGGSVRADSAGRWWTSIPSWERSFYPAWQENKEIIIQRWDDRFGDRINELIIIGQDLNQQAITEELEECICTDEEIYQMKKNNFIDSFPVFE